jgi:hypothetical protein
MFVRSKLVKGQTYYQLIQGYRVAGKVRHRTIASLGRNPTVEGALVSDKQLLARLRREHARLESSGPLPPDLRRKLDRLARRVEGLAAKVALLKSVVDGKYVDATPTSGVIVEAEG